MPSSIKEFKSLNYEGTVSRLYNKTAGSETSLETDENLTSTPVSSSNTDQKDQDIEQAKPTEFNPDEIIEIPEDEILTSNTVNSSNTDQKDQDKT